MARKYTHICRFRKYTFYYQDSLLFADMSNFLKLFCSHVKFSYWSKFHVNIMTGSGVMAISYYKGLTRNLKTRNTPVWALFNIWRLGKFRNTKSGMNVSNKMLLNAKKYRSYSFYRFWVNQQWVKLLPTLSIPPNYKLGLKRIPVRKYWNYCTSTSSNHD